MTVLLVAAVVTLGMVFVCSLLEALILSTTVTEIESLKKRHPKRGLLLERLKLSVEDSISAILTLNTIGQALGSMYIGTLAGKLFGPTALTIFTACYGIVLLVGAEVLPKNVGVSSRRQLQPYLAYPLWLICWVFRPVSYLCNLVVRFFIKVPEEHHKSDEEILLLAERGAQQGTLSKSESSIIANALSLDNVRVTEIMTPRTVVSSLRKAATVGEVFKEFPNIPFARIPVYGRNLDDIVGLVRRRDLLKAKANAQDAELVEKLMLEVHFVPETVTVANALQVFLKTHQQILVVVDEFGSMAGVISMEDVMEHLLGREIFEKDDVAVDMRELARARQAKASKAKKTA